VFLGSRFVLPEYACGVFFSVALGLFVMPRSHSFWQMNLGVYLKCLGINDLSMLVHAVGFARQQSAHAELGDELADRRRAMSK
jgi:hypothetical protein